MADLINRKVINTTLSKDNAEKLRTLSKRKGIPQTRVLDRAVDTLYQKEEASMEGAAKHKGIAICIANNKGGVGKTTSTAAFADLLSKRGKHVLVIDADPQGNLSGRFGYSADSPEQAIPNYLGSLIEDRFRGTEHQPLGYFINHLDEFPRIDIIYSDIRLDGVYTLLTTDSIASATMFRKLLAEIRSLDKYDYILIDARPAVNNEVSSIFIGSDYVIIPVEASWDSIVGANTITSSWPRAVSSTRRSNCSGSSSQRSRTARRPSTRCCRWSRATGTRTSSRRRSRATRMSSMRRMRAIRSRTASRPARRRKLM